RDASIHIRDRHRHSGNHGAGRIVDVAENAAHIRLREQRDRTQKHEQTHTYHQTCANRKWRGIHKRTSCNREFYDCLTQFWPETITAGMRMSMRGVSDRRYLVTAERAWHL